MEEKRESKISYVEWGLVIGALFTIDLVQVALEWMVIGLFINPLIDIFTGLSFGFYLHMRGESLAEPKRLLGIIVTFLGEQIPGIDALLIPLWTIDGVYSMFLAKGSKIISNIPGVGLIKNNLTKK